MPPAAGYTIWCNASDNDNLFTNYDRSGQATDGQSVRHWDDESDATTYSFAHSNSGASPTFDADGFNGVGCLLFDGSDDKLYFSTDDYGSWPAISTLISASAWTLFASFVMTGDGGSTDPSYVSNDRIIGDGLYWGVYLSTVGGQSKCSAFQYTAGGAKYATVNISQNTEYVVCAKYDGTDLTIDINNGALTATTTAGNISDVTNIAMMGAGTFLTGKIGEIAIYNTALSGTNLSDTWSYMTSKWIPAAPSGHPAAKRLGGIPFATPNLGRW